ncbi:MAG TPA: menaquinone biosynthesis protein [Bacteroidales bacterium]|nr:menaquinone biosynthesis protein [Bacteroidales bacterium]HQG56687.1 menaquinone biosynthesis protein [Bacteroidales bacterium]HQK71329.1 menaquinone biosynthesis protein [Bacteroidales bacterium]
MEKIRISIVKYANSYPFVWGLKNSNLEKEAIIETDHPAVCASKLINGKVDIGLIPVVSLPEVKNHEIISDYCIGAYEKVKTVMLLSNSSFEAIKTVYLDYRSRSSVALARVLAKNMWKREFVWKETDKDFDFLNISEDEAIVVIGNQCFEFEPHFSFGLDLAEEWKKYTGYPFVFACWAAGRKIDRDFLEKFDRALRFGLDNIDRVVEDFSNSSPMRGETLKKYLTHNIDYIFDEKKKEGLKLFMGMVKEL